MCKGNINLPQKNMQKCWWVKKFHLNLQQLLDRVQSPTKQTEEREDKKTSLFWSKKDNEKGKSKCSLLSSFLNSWHASLEKS